MLKGTWLIPVLCSGVALCAQSLGDLNGLAQAAAHFCSHGMAAGRDPGTAALYRITGDQGGAAPSPMTKGVDVTHWSFQYKLVAVGTDPGPDGGLAVPESIHQGVLAECTRGIFGKFQYSTALVTDARSLEYTWIAISLDDALAQVKAHGYSGTFEKVTLMRPMNPSIPDEYVYIFDCPADHVRVAISTQTGALMWTEKYRC